MINIAIYCVTYNSYNAAMNYLSSIDKILDESQPALTVFLADNTTNNPIEIKYKTEKFKLFTSVAPKAIDLSIIEPILSIDFV